MSFRRRRLGLILGTVAMLVTLICVQAFAASGPIRILGIYPSTINPARAQYARIIFSVPDRGDYTVSVRNDSGQTVRRVAAYRHLPPGGRMAVWNGRDNSNRIVADGAYTVVVEGKTSAGEQLAPATGEVIVNSGGSSTQPSQAFTISNITPSTIDPSKGEIARATYVVPTRADYRVYVRNGSGAEVRGIVTYRDMPAGTRSTAWDGRDNSRRVVPDGAYTLVIEGKTSGGAQLTTATGTITVQTDAGTNPPTQPGGGFTVTNVTPSPFDPGQDESTTVHYTVPTRADCRIYVRDDSGAEVRGLVNYRGIPAGSYTRTWDGKDRYGRAVEDGTYTVVIDGTASGTSTPITTGTGAVTVSNDGATTPPPTTYTFDIESVTPTTIDPSEGETASIRYEVPTTADYKLYVRTSSGAEVRTIATGSDVAAGKYSRTWDGKNASGQVVANGAYTVVLEGATSTGASITPDTASVTVDVTTTTPPVEPPPPTNSGELGQTIEGAGSANFAWLQYSGRKFGIAFQAPKSGSISEITMQWKKSSGYGAGTYGRYTFELQSNGSDNFPSGNVITRTENVDPRTAMDGYIDGAFHFPMNATLQAGQIYHIVITNVDSNPSSNWSSPNTLMTGVKPWDGTGQRGAVYQNGRWQPWTSTSNVFNTSGSNFVNGSHVPIMLKFTDGSIWGDPYYSAAMSGGAYFYGSNRAGQFIYWDRPSTSISKVGICVGKRGNPGSLIYHLETSSGQQLATGTIATASQVGSTPTWVYANLPSAVTLTQGQSYRLWFESPSSSSSSSCFYQYVPYGENRPAEWLQGSWGGTRSYYTTSSGGSWTTRTNYDLTFSLQ